MNEHEQRSDDEQVPAEVRERLRAASSSVRPAGPVSPSVCGGVRRRRRRAFVAGLAGSAVVSLVVSVGVAMAMPNDGSDVGPAGAPSEGSSGAAFTCATESRVFTEVPPIPDLEEQRRVVRELRDLRPLTFFSVRHAEPTALGVVALVVGHEGAAREALTDLGVAIVERYDPSAADVGVDDHGQVLQVLQWRLEPVLADVRSAVRDVPGDAGLALWQEAGAVLLQWKAPVPEQVQALAGTRADGVRVIVEGVDYSRADVRRAQTSLEQWLQASGHRDEWTSSSACADGTGLVVGMVPGAVDTPGLAEAIQEAVGMPVLVVPEERPVELLPQEDAVG